MAHLRSVYIPDGPQAQLPDYCGEDNDQLDTGITEAAVGIPRQDFKPCLAPRPHSVTNKILRNPDGAFITQLTEYYNRYRRSVTLLQDWCTDAISFVSKYGKPLALNLLHPSLLPN
ncbi:hypothetical protein HPB48_013015 [Haemaphysalis longicornis]|uniref:Uncharacterized protein n=1 Tax=Haemaphysalis longicornis TaxID=44386 RepID=A0A9J6GT89_HAELO|nr:hypothetical protein HPB48_013015 [Haemaphysalis longicornis]